MGIPGAGNALDSFAREMSQLNPPPIACLVVSDVRPEPSERRSAQGQTKPLSYSRLRKRSC